MKKGKKKKKKKEKKYFPEVLKIVLGIGVKGW